jgi:hypothetical protein
MLATFVATVPFRVGTQELAPGTTPPSGEQVDVKHALVAAMASTHVPVALQVPPQAPAVQEVPAGAKGFEHPPVPPSPAEHVPARWHESSATHVTGGPFVHVPFWQVSPVKHAFPLLQAVPLLATGLVQVPLEGWQVPAVWH